MSEQISNKKKIFTVGTLTYTAAGLAILFGWLLMGDFAWSMKERGVNSTATIMIKSFGVSDFLYSLIIISFPSFTNIFLGPIMSYISDRHRGRLGRRIPYLIFTTPFIVVGLLGLAFTPYLASKLHLSVFSSICSYNAVALGVFFVFWILLDFGTTISNVIFVALVNDVVPKEFLGRFFGFFRAISLCAGILYNFYLLEMAKSYAAYIFFGLAIIYGVGFMMMCIKVKEGEYPEIPECERNEKKSFLGAIKNYFRECFSLPYYRWAIGAIVLAQLAALPLNTYTIFYAESINVSMKLLGTYLAITYIISFTMSFFLGVLADKYHPIRTTMVSSLVYCIYSIASPFIVQGQTSFAVIFILHGVISGCTGTLGSSYGQRLYPKLIFAQFNSAMSGVLFLGFTVIAPFTGLLLDLTGNRYYLVFYMGALISGLAFLAFIVVLKYYKRLGGDKNYEAPMVD